METFLFDLPFMFAFGIFFGAFVQPDERDGLVFLSKAFIHGMILNAIGIVFVIFGYMVEPDWFLMYFVEGPRPGLFGLPFILFFVYVLPFVAGFLVKIELDKLEIPIFNWILGIGGLVTSYLVGYVFLADRFLVSGTREQYLAGTAKPLMAANSGLSWLMLLYLAARFGYLAYFIAWVWLPMRRANKG